MKKKVNMRKMAHDDFLTYSIVNRKYDAKPLAGTIFVFTLKSRTFEIRVHAENDFIVMRECLQNFSFFGGE